jgi:ribonuclease HI
VTRNGENTPNDCISIAPPKKALGEAHHHVGNTGSKQHENRDGLLSATARGQLRGRINRFEASMSKGMNWRGTGYRTQMRNQGSVNVKDESERLENDRAARWLDRRPQQFAKPKQSSDAKSSDVKTSDAIIVHFDGACDPNPNGAASFGVIICRAGRTIWQASEAAPDRGKGTSCNFAEYAGLIAALRYLLDAGLNRERVLVHGDSQLVINQMFGRWRIKGGGYADLAREAKTWRARTSEKTLSIDLMAQRRFPPHGQSRILALAFGLP